MAYERKTYTLWTLCTNYGHGWEEETSSLSWYGHCNDKADYRANCPGVQLKTKRTRCYYENDAERAKIAAEISRERKFYRDRMAKKRNAHNIQQLKEVLA